MKKLLFLLMFPVLCFGQEISLKELISISNMDSESFEIYAINKGYKFSRFHKSDDKVYGLRMGCHINDLYRRIDTFDSIPKFGLNKTDSIPKFSLNRSVLYKSEAGDSELPRFLSELKSLNYTLIEVKSEEEGDYVKTYESSDKKKIIYLSIQGGWLYVLYVFQLEPFSVKF